MKAEIVVAGKKRGRLQASWLLLKESWRYLRADSELLLVPVVTTIMLVFLFASLLLIVLLLGGVSVYAETKVTPETFLIIFAGYCISAYTIALAEAAVAYTVSVRSTGGNATLGQSFGVALRHTPALLLWSFVMATVGIVLRTISERSKLLGNLTAQFMGAAWSIATYFVVPAIVLDSKRVFPAIPHSASVFRRMWGETVITNISIWLVFLVGHIIAVLALFGTFVLAVAYDLPALFMVVLVLWLVWLCAALLVQSVLNAIIKTLLYVYASSSVPPQNFNLELLNQIMPRRPSESLRPVETPVANETSERVPVPTTEQ
jgi:Family of unknown function (DUF6159)